MANLVKIERFIDVMSEVPAILFIQARTGHEWMSEEIRARFTPEFVALVDEIGDFYFNSKRSEPMQPIGMCWFVAKEISDEIYSKIKDQARTQ